MEVLGQELTPVKYLSLHAETLEQVVINSLRNNASNFSWRLPLLSNLRKLVLLGMRRESRTADADDIAEILLVSPGLKSLGLSLEPEEGMVNHVLKRLIKYYHSRRTELGIPLLQLSELRLGFGFIPTGSYIAFPEDDYMSQLTQLNYLTHLQIDNWHSNPGDIAVPFYSIHIDLFAAAKNLKKITVERVSSDIGQLCEMLRFSNDGISKLDEIEVYRYFETLDPIKLPSYDPTIQGEPLYSECPSAASFAWRKIAYGTKIESHKMRRPGEGILYRLIKWCEELEELAAPVDGEELYWLKTVVVPKAKKLRILMLSGSYLESNQFLQPSYDLWRMMSQEMKNEYEARTTEEVEEGLFHHFPNSLSKHPLTQPQSTNSKEHPSL